MHHQFTGSEFRLESLAGKVVVDKMMVESSLKGCNNTDLQIQSLLDHTVIKTRKDS